jgi:hypothetical protein
MLREATNMSDQKYPTGWDGEKIRKVLTFYDTQPEDEALKEDEAAMEIERDHDGRSS